MKKKILIFIAIIIALSLSAFVVTNKEFKNKKQNVKAIAIKSNNKLDSNFTYKEPIGPVLKNDTIDTIKTKPEVFEDFIYDVGSRFKPMKKSAIKKATSLNHFFTEEELSSISSIKFVEIIVIENERQTQKREIGYTKSFTDAQLKLIKSFDYSSHFNIRIEYLQKNYIGQLEHKFNSPHITIVPEKQAEYIKGKEALKTYLRENSKAVREEANVDPMKLQPAKLYFTVSKDGKISDVKLDRSSNYPLVDKTMIALIKKLPGKWNPAENEKGEKISQEQVVSFGLIGC